MAATKQPQVVQPFVRCKFRNKCAIDSPDKSKYVYRVFSARNPVPEDAPMLKFNKKARYTSKCAMAAARKVIVRLTKQNNLAVGDVSHIIITCSKISTNKQTGRIVESQYYYPVFVKRVYSAKPKTCYNYTKEDREKRKAWSAEMTADIKSGQGVLKKHFFDLATNTVKEYTPEEIKVTSDFVDPETKETEKRTIVHGMEEIGYRFVNQEKNLCILSKDGYIIRQDAAETTEQDRISPLVDAKTSVPIKRTFAFDTKRVKFDENAPEMQHVLKAEANNMAELTVPLKQLLREDKIKEKEKQKEVDQRAKAKALKQKEMEKKKKEAQVEKLKAQKKKQQETAKANAQKAKEQKRLASEKAKLAKEKKRKAEPATAEVRKPKKAKKMDASADQKEAVKV